MGTAITYARRNHKTIEEVMNTNAQEVYMVMLYDYDMSVFEKKLSDIRKRAEQVAKILAK